MDDVFRIRSAPGTFWRHGNSRCWAQRDTLQSRYFLFFSNLTSWKMKSGGKKEKEEEEAGIGCWGVEHHDIAARSFFFKKDVGMTKCIVIEASQKRLLEGGM